MGMPEAQLDPDDYWAGWKRRMLNTEEPETFEDHDPDKYRERFEDDAKEDEQHLAQDNNV